MFDDRRAHRSRARVGQAATSSSANSDNLLNGAVYTQTDLAANTVAAFYRAQDGTLSPAGSYSTGGAGSNGNLAGQGSVVLSGGSSAEVSVAGNQLLFVTNAGSNTLSVFRVEQHGLVLASTAPTNGQRPLSVTVHQDLVYVVNQTTSNITGFRVSPQGILTAIPGSTRLLSVPGNPAQIGFSPDGRLLVTEGRESQVIDTYLVDKKSGLVEGPHANPTRGPEPFSFTFDRRDHLFMTESHFVAPGAGSTTSYELLRDGSLASISSAAPNLQSVPCWIVITNNQRFIYDASGAIALRQSVAGVSGSFPPSGRNRPRDHAGQRFPQLARRQWHDRGLRRELRRHPHAARQPGHGTSRHGLRAGVALTLIHQPLTSRGHR